MMEESEFPLETHIGFSQLKSTAGFYGVENRVENCDRQREQHV